jgi:hypothetical protein
MRFLTKLFAAFVPLIASPAIAAPSTSASDLYGSICINIHANWGTAPWGTVNWPSRLTELGISCVRTNAMTPRATMKLASFFQAGGKADVVYVDSLDQTAATNQLAYLKSSVGLYHLIGIEGPNEYNGKTATWAADLQSFAKFTHDKVRADAAFNGIRLISPSMNGVTLSIFQQLGNLSRYADRGNIHLYTGRHRPTFVGGGSMALWFSYASTVAKPIWMTEMGWMTAGKLPVSQKAQAKYVLRAYFDAYANGAEKSFIYELMDDQTNLLGLLDNYGNPKQAFTALKNMLALVKDTGPGGQLLAATVSGAPADLKVYQFTRSDGKQLVVLYRDVDSATSTGADFDPAPINVTVSFSRRMSKIELFRPTYGAASAGQASGASAIVPVADDAEVVVATP